MVVKIIYAVLITGTSLLLAAKEYAVKERVRSWLTAFFRKSDIQLIALKEGTLLHTIKTNSKVIRKAIYYSLFHIIIGGLSYFIWDARYATVYTALGIFAVIQFWASGGFYSV